jgi:hypothetical protein
VITVTPAVLNPKLLIALAVACFALGTYCLVVGDYKGVLLFLAAAYFSYSYFKHNPVELAFRAVARGQMPSAARLLALVSRPEQLASRDRAYFELGLGLAEGIASREPTRRTTPRAGTRARLAYRK